MRGNGTSRNWTESGASPAFWRSSQQDQLIDPAERGDGDALVREIRDPRDGTPLFHEESVRGVLHVLDDRPADRHERQAAGVRLDERDHARESDVDRSRGERFEDLRTGTELRLFDLEAVRCPQVLIAGHVQVRTVGDGRVPDPDVRGTWCRRRLRRAGATHRECEDEGGGLHAAGP